MSVDSSTGVVSGHLYRLSNKLMFKVWTKRYVELRNDTFYYYNSKTTALSGVIKLNSSVVFEDSNLRHFCFSLSDASTGEIHYFAAENAEELEYWSERIRLPLMKAKHTATRPNMVSMTTKVRKEYLSRPILHVNVIRSRNLLDMDLGGTSDPYVNVYVGSSIMKTGIKYKTLNPEWNALFSFDMNRSCRYAKIEVFDKDNAKSDDFIGRVMIPLMPLRDGITVRKWYSLGKKSTKAITRGDIELELSVNGDWDIERNATRFFEYIRLLPELRINFLNPAVQPDLHSSFEDSFPFIFPPSESEWLEDICVRCQLSCVTYSSRASCKGVLLLTNYRLIFISLSKILNENSDNTKAGLYCSTTSLVNDLTTQIPLGCISSINLNNEPDPTNNNTVSEILRLETVDHRSMTFVFRGDLEYLPQNGGVPSNISTNNPTLNKRRDAGKSNSDFTDNSTGTGDKDDDKSNDSLSALETSWMALIGEPAAVIEAMDSDEGSPFNRIHTRIHHFVS